MVVMEVTRDSFNKIMSGEKQAEIRNKYKDLTGKFVGLRIIGNKKMDAVVKIGQVLDLRYLNPEDKDFILRDCFISEEFQQNNSCDFCYTITEIMEIH